MNWVELTVTTQDREILYRNSFATNHIITQKNLEDIVVCGRTRWKVENENNNTLKTKGYHLEHNYGHGQQHLSCLLATLIVLSFLFHTVLNCQNSAEMRVNQRPAPSGYYLIANLPMWCCELLMTVRE